MSNISERLVVRCPYHEAPPYLASFFAKHQIAKDRVACIALHLPEKLFADRHFMLAPAVVATLYPVQSISDPSPRYLVIWSPKVGDWFPELGGRLAFARSSRDNCLDLVINSHYEVPLNGKGSLLDDACNRRIIHGSARALLRSAAHHIEVGWAHDEAARAGYSPLTHFTLDWSDSEKILELCGMPDRSAETNIGPEFAPNR